MHPDTHVFHAALVPEDRKAAIARVDHVAPERDSCQARVIRWDHANGTRRKGRPERLA